LRAKNTCFAARSDPSIPRNEGLDRLRKPGARRQDLPEADTDELAGGYTPAILTSWREIPAEALERLYFTML
jgi:hypothetical protein